ncbi:MAG: sulfite exporter TauE/SafE family protein [Sedimentisphaerales bacterium]|nr:sulfite exporter TauE/SafE family protein [Sedimentisphaerales bacterium]
MDFSFLDWATIALCAVIMGASKSGLPGLSILAVPLMANVFDTKESTGLLLGILIIGDIFAIIYHRQNAKWKYIVRLLPATLCGIVAGYFGMKEITNEQLRPIIGVIVLLMLGLNYWRMNSKKNEDKNIPAPLWLSFWLGFLAGVTTMMANAAGPVMIIYLVAMRLPKMEFVGTAAWFFFIINWIKVPFSANLGLMNMESIKVDLLMIPFIFIGAICGYFVLQKIPQRTFNAVAQLLAAAAAIKLLF